MGEGIGLGGLREGKLSHILCAECPLNFQLSLIQHPLAFHMNQPISRRVHGVLDYSAASLVAAAPALLGFSNDKAASTLAYILGGNILALTLATRAE